VDEIMTCILYVNEEYPYANSVRGTAFWKKLHCAGISLTQTDNHFNMNRQTW